MIKAVKELFKDSLFRNSFYLMLATAVMAGFGFFFWLINARLYSAESIGLATTLISIMSLIGGLSLIGFNATFVRFLPKSEKPNDEMNTGLILVGIAAGILGLIFVLFIKRISPSLAFMAASPLVSLAFIFFCIMTGINIITDSVFLAQRQAKYTLIINTIFSAVKMVLPFAFVGWGALGVFSAAALGQTVGMILSVGVMIWKFNYRPQFVIKMQIVKRVWAYAARNYLAGVINLLPVTVLPLLITNSLGAKSAGYFYIAMMIGNLLYVIPYSTTRSMFAESSHDEHATGSHIKKAIKINAALLLPAVAILVGFGNIFLKIFGKGYSSEGAGFLKWVALTGLAVFAYSLFNTLLQLRKNSNAIIFINIVYASAIIAFSYLLLPLGLTGIGMAWFIGTAMAGFTGFVLYRWSESFNLEKFGDLFFDLEMVVMAKLGYAKALIKHGFKSRTILFYPENPKPYHVIYSIVKMLGFKISNDPKQPADLVMAFADKTFRPNDEVLTNLAKSHKVINFNCGDISKERVDKIFTEVFGYEMAIDPTTYAGPAVRKSNLNAKHDGQVITCPTTREPGYVYQKLINNRVGDTVYDLRVVIYGNTLPFVIRRYRMANDRFDHTKTESVKKTSDCFSASEVELILEFSKRFGLEYGELDVLRDNDSGKIYVVDVNNSPAPPKPGVHVSHKIYYTQFLNQLIAGFKAVFGAGN